MSKHEHPPMLPIKDPRDTELEDDKERAQAEYQSWLSDTRGGTK